MAHGVPVIAESSGERVYHPLSLQSVQFSRGTTEAMSLKRLCGYLAEGKDGRFAMATQRERNPKDKGGTEPVISRLCRARRHFLDIKNMAKSKGNKTTSILALNSFCRKMGEESRTDRHPCCSVQRP